MKGTPIFSDHVKKRIEENGLSMADVQFLWRRCRRVIMPKGMLEYKWKKYGHLNKHIEYYWCNGYLLTIKRPNILITVTKQSLFTVKLV